MRAMTGDSLYETNGPVFAGIAPSGGRHPGIVGGVATFVWQGPIEPTFL